MAELFNLAKKGPGENTGGLIPGRQKRTSLRGSTSKKRSTYSSRARRKLMEQVTLSDNLQLRVFVLFGFVFF